jgi:type II secretory pathway pseudopilin PulG
MTKNQEAKSITGFVIVLGLALVIAFILLANWNKAKKTAHHNQCINQLRLIDAAQEQYMLEHHLTIHSAPPPLKALSSYFGKSGIPQCPDGGTYTLYGNGQPPTCSLGSESDHVLRLPSLNVKP